MISLSDETRPKDWHYLAEGAEAIVCSYCGPPHPIFDETVIRLRKVNPSPSGRNKDTKGAPAPTHVNSFDFYERVIRKLIPREFTDKQSLVSVQADWLHMLNDCITKSRLLQNRNMSSHLDVQSTYAALGTNLIGGGGWGVEIKPKWGFMPNPRYLSKETKPWKTRFCRYCLHTCLKEKTGKPHASQFCPLDLFSCDDTRIRRALSALWSAWSQTNATVNNLRLFVDSQFLSSSSEDSLLALQQELGSGSAAANDLRRLFVEAIAPVIMNSPLLPLLCDLQKSLDVIDIEGIRQMCGEEHTRSFPDNFGEIYPEPTITGWEAVLERYLASDVSCAVCSQPSKDLDVGYYLAAYTLSATFKDASIIIRPAQRGAPPTVTVLDLDVKRVAKIPEWYSLDQEIVECAMHSSSHIACSNVLSAVN